MAFLVDTNVLLRFASPTDPGHRAARGAIEILENEGEELFVTGQNLIEAWNVTTRPVDKNGLGFDTQRADALIGKLEKSFVRLDAQPGTYRIWRELVVEMGVSGAKAHDTRLVAVMIGHAVRSILTFNTQDFRRFGARGIRAVDPWDLTSEA